MRWDDRTRLERIAANAEAVADIQHYRAVQAALRAATSPNPVHRELAQAEAERYGAECLRWRARAAELRRRLAEPR